MDTTQIIIAILGIISGLIGGHFTRTSKKEENKQTADEFTFKALQSENQRLYKTVEDLQMKLQLAQQETIDLRTQFANELEEIKNQLNGWQTTANHFKGRVDDLESKLSKYNID